MIGSRIDGYAIEQRLGTGASADVFVARDEALGRHVVIKLARDDKADALLEREAALLAGTSANGLVEIYGRGRYQERIYLVLERAEGESLRELLARAQLPRAEALRIARDLAAGLAALHAAGIAHLDVKPENVVVARSRARLVDFGAARSTHEARADERGTPAYLAPERGVGDPGSAASDVWSLGVLLHELCSGERPSGAVLASAIPPLSHELVEIIERCLADAPAVRPDAADLTRALEAELARLERSLEASPFVGLAPYGQRHSPVFFGRDTQLARLSQMARDPGPVALVGAPGAGKTSLLRAGLLPRFESTGAWRTIYVAIPARSPLLALARAISRADASGDNDPDAAARRAELLAEAPAMAALMLDALVPHDQTLLLVVDDLDRLLDAEQAEAHAVLEALATAGAGRGATRVVVALRDVALGRLAALGGTGLLERVVAIGEPQAHEVAQVVERAAGAFDYRCEPSDLAKRIGRDVAGRNNGLALLQFALCELWTRRDKQSRCLRGEDYDATGGVGGALEQHADGALAALGHDELDGARQLLLALVDGDGNAQPRERADLERRGGARIVDALMTARLLRLQRADDGDTASYITLAHEALSSWPTLVSWRRSRELAHAIAGELERAASLWHARGERDAELWDAAALEELARIAPGDPGGETVERFVTASRARALDAQRARRFGFGALIALLIGALGVSTWLVTRPKAKSNTSKATSKSQARDARARTRRSARLERDAQAALASGQLVHARALLREALELEDRTALRALWWQLRPPPEVTRWSQRRRPSALVASPDGHRVAMLDSRATAVLSIEWRGGTTAALGARPVKRRLLAAVTGARALAFVGRGFATIGQRGELRVWQRIGAPPLLLAKLAHGSGSMSLAADDAGRWLAASDGITLSLWARQNGAGKRATWRLMRAGSRSAADCRPRALAFAAQSLLVGCKRGQLLRIALAGTFAKTLLGAHAGAVRFVAATRDGLRFASADDREVRIVALADGHVLAARRMRRVQNVRFWPDGSLLVVTQHHRALRLDARGVTREAVFAGQVAAPLAGRRLLRAHGTNLALVAGSAARWRWGALRGHTAPTQDVAISADGSLYASIGAERALQLWSERGRSVSRLPLPSRGTALCVLDDGIAVGDRHGVVRRLGLTGAVLEAQALHRGAVHALRCAANSTVVSSGHDGKVVLWRSGSTPRTLTTHRAAARDVVLSPDGRDAASASVDGTIRRVSLGIKGKGKSKGKGATRWLIANARRPLYRVVYSTDGRWLAAVGPRALLIVDTTNGKRRHLLAGVSGGQLTFLPDDLEGRGALLISDAAGRRRRIDPASARQLELTRPDRAWRLTRLVRSPRQLLGAALDGTVRRWDLRLASLGRGDEKTGRAKQPRRRATVQQQGKSVSLALVGDRLEARLGTKLAARRYIGPGATALCALESGWVAVGMLDGSVELRHLHIANARVTLPARPTAVANLRSAPRQTLVVSHRGGHVVLWHVPTRTRLHELRLHGSVAEIGSRGTTWRLRSELGDQHLIDFGPFADTHCALLRRIWRASPWVVRSGRLQRQRAPLRHPCKPRKP